MSDRDHKDPLWQRIGASWLRDLRQGVRVLGKSPGFSLVVVLSLAVGIAGTSAMFSIFNTLMLRSLAVAQPQELSFLRYGVGARFRQVSFPMFERLRQSVPAGARVAAMSRVARMEARTDRDAQPGPAAAQLVSGEYFSTLGLAPARGRLLADEDNRVAGGHPVAVLGHAFWRQRFAGSEDILGRTMALNGARFTIVGVAPAGFSGVWLESPTDVWIPLAMQASVHYAQNVHSSNSDTNQPWMRQERIEWLEVIARTSPPQRATVSMTLHRAFEQSLAAVGDGVFVKERQQALRQGPLELEPFEGGFSNLRQRFAAPLYVLMGMAAILLLIACANTANLLLARAASRRHEIALRLSVGATRARLVQQLLMESVLLGSLAGVLGLCLAPVISQLLLRMATGSTAGPLPFAVPIDARVVAFTAVLSLVTIAIFGLMPAVSTTGLDLATALKAGGRGTQSGGRGRSAKLLVVAQVALSLVLVVVAGLFLRSLQGLLSVELGYERVHRLSVAIDARAGYSSEERPALYRRLVERAAALPGVQSAALASCGLAASCRATSSNIAISGYQAGPEERVELYVVRVGTGYFSTVGMPLVSGRDFDGRDHTQSAEVAIINEAFARRYFAGRSPLGQKFGGGTPRTEIVGVVRDARLQTVREEARPTAFYFMNQEADWANTLEVRTAGDPRWLAEPLRWALLQAEPRLQLTRVTTASEQIERNVNQERAIARLTAVLGVLALGLACFGLYGVMSYAVARRTAELGVRLALGAPRARVLWMVLRESLSLVVAGLVAGLALVVALSRVLASQLFGVAPTDPATVVTAAAGMILVATAAAYLPAWRASRVDPLVALRSE